jgi:hypothetical protein
MCQNGFAQNNPLCAKWSGSLNPGGFIICELKLLRPHRPVRSIYLIDISPAQRKVRHFEPLTQVRDFTPAVGTGSPDLKIGGPFEWASLGKDLNEA